MKKVGKSIRSFRYDLGLPRRSNQSILKKINPEYSLGGLMLKLKLHYFGHLMRRADPLEKTLMLVKTEVKRRMEQQKMKSLESITHSMDVNLSKPWEIVDRGAWHAAVHGIRVRCDLASEQQQQVISTFCGVLYTLSPG